MISSTLVARACRACSQIPPKTEHRFSRMLEILTEAGMTRGEAMATAKAKMPGSFRAWSEARRLAAIRLGRIA